MSGRPLDVLEAAVGDDVEVRLKSGEIYRGTLAGYDQHMNLVLDDVVESPVDSTASEADAGAGADPSERSNADSDGGGVDPDGGDSDSNGEDIDSVDGSSDSRTDGSSDSDAEAPERGRDTTIIRGDNVVSINP